MEEDDISHKNNFWLVCESKQSRSDKQHFQMKFICTLNILNDEKNKMMFGKFIGNFKNSRKAKSDPSDI